MHTPGPWHRNIPPAKKYPTIFAGRNTHICVVQSLGLSDEEVEANTNLIVAAPELLDALKSLLQDAKDRFTEVPGNVYHKAVDAIAKAEGKCNGLRIV